MRCMSIGVGSATSALRCIRMPTGRCSRTACCAAAIERGRPTVIGITMPGNSTVLRTGTMISASGGSGGRARRRRVVRAPARPASAMLLSGLHDLVVSHGRPRFLQCDQQTAVAGRALDGAVAPGRQPHAPLEPSLRQLEAVDDGRPHLRRQHAGAGEHQVVAVDRGFDAVRIDARQRHQHQHLALGLQHVDRRLPCRRAAPPSAPAGRTRDAAARRARASRRPPTTSSEEGDWNSLQPHFDATDLSIAGGKFNALIGPRAVGHLSFTSLQICSSDPHGLAWPGQPRSYGTAVPRVAVAGTGPSMTLEVCDGVSKADHRFRRTARKKAPLARGQGLPSTWNF